MSLDDYLGTALGALGMGAGEFWEMTPHDFFLKLHYHNRQEEDRYRALAELARLQTLTLVNIQLARKDKIRDPRRLWTFPWERPRRPSGERDESREDAEGLSRMAKLI